MQIKELNEYSDRACSSGKYNKDVNSEINFYLCQNQNQMPLGCKEWESGRPKQMIQKDIWNNKRCKWLGRF